MGYVKSFPKTRNKFRTPPVPWRLLHMWFIILHQSHGTWLTLKNNLVKIYGLYHGYVMYGIPTYNTSVRYLSEELCALSLVSRVQRWNLFSYITHTVTHMHRDEQHDEIIRSRINFILRIILCYKSVKDNEVDYNNIT